MDKSDVFVKKDCDAFVSQGATLLSFEWWGVIPNSLTRTLPTYVSENNNSNIDIWAQNIYVHFDVIAYTVKSLI